MAGPALVPAHGGKVHAIRPQPGRPLPEVGSQVVWRTECGLIVLGYVKDWREVGSADHCQRCPA